MSVTIGTAGWTIPRDAAGHFPAEGSSLERYAARFGGAEINSSFHRPHRRSTWERWAASVPEDFRFAVKLPKTISHQNKLAGCDDLVAAFLDESAGLGAKLAILLLQLPPKLAFDAGLAEAFLADLGRRSPARIVCEPRHPSWFEDGADRLLRDLGVARVAADPAVVPAAARPGGALSLQYWRLHGSPVMYRSPYGPERLGEYAGSIRAAGQAETWCMFDNTASSAATMDALDLLSIL